MENTIALLTTYKYILLFPSAIAEGPIISVGAGFLCSLQLLNPIVTYFLLVLADLIGDTIYYSIGRFGGRPFIHRWGRFFRINEEKLYQIKEHFNNHAGKTLAIGKTQPWGMLVLVASGLGEMSFTRFIGINFLVTVIKTFLLMLIGYYFGQSYVFISDYFGIYGAVSMGIFALIALAYFLFFRKKKLS